MLVQNHITPIPVTSTNDRFKISVPNNIKKITDNSNTYCIYSISRIDKDKAYVGKTANISKRLYSWTWAINCNKPKFLRHKLVKALKKHPNKFVVKILSVCSKKETNLEEDKYIKIFGKYNTRRGGGGGSASKKKRSSIKKVHSSSKKVLSPSSSEKNTSKFATPERKYFFDIKNGKLKNPLSPSTKNLSNLVYMIGSIYGHRLPGSTGRTFGKRIGEYIHALQDQEHSKTDGIGKIAPHLLRSPSKWFAVLLKQTPNYKKREIEAIAEKRLNGFNVVNCNRGGGGPEPDSETKKLVSSINPKRKIVFD